MQRLTRGSRAASHQALVEPIEMPKAPIRVRVDLRPAGQVADGLHLVEHHHAPQHAAAPQHLLESVVFAQATIGNVLPLGKAPAIDGQRDDAFFGHDRGVGRQHCAAANELVLAQLIGAAMRVNVDQPRRLGHAFVGQEQQCRHGFQSVEIELQMFERVTRSALGGN